MFFLDFNVGRYQLKISIPKPGTISLILKSDDIFEVTTDVVGCFLIMKKPK